MWRISIKMLLHNTAQFAVTVLGVALLFFLSASLVGLLVGWCRTTSAIVRHSEADLWVMARHTPALDYGTSIPRHRIYQVRNTPGVAWAEGLIVAWNYWKRADGRQVNIVLVGLDDSCGAGPWKMRSATPEVVHDPDAVIVDELYLDVLGVSGIGDEVEILSKRAVVRGISQDVRTFTASPFVFTSLTDAIRYDQRYRDDEITYVLVRCSPDADPLVVKNNLLAQVPDVEVLTRDEFASRTMRYWMLETGAGVTLVVTSLLGMIVGGMITSQTLYAITQSHLAEHATLLALGFRRAQLVDIVGLQGLLIGVCGVTLGSAAFFYAAHLSARTLFTLETTPLVFATLVGVSLASCIVASFLAVRSIFRIDPVLVFTA